MIYLTCKPNTVGAKIKSLMTASGGNDGNARPAFTGLTTMTKFHAIHAMTNQSGSKHQKEIPRSDSVTK